MTDKKEPEQSNSDRLEQEIEDVLSRVENFEWRRFHRHGPSQSRRLWNQFWVATTNIVGRNLARFTTGHLMLMGFLFLIAGLVVRGRGPGLWLVFAGALLFITGLVIRIRNSQGTSSAPYGSQGGYWRDRYITYKNHENSRSLEKLLGWLKKRLH